MLLEAGLKPWEIELLRPVELDALVMNHIRTTTDPAMGAV